MQPTVDFLIAHQVAISGWVLFTISELIGINPNLAQSSIIQMIQATLKKISGKEWQDQRDAAFDKLKSAKSEEEFQAAAKALQELISK